MTVRDEAPTESLIAVSEHMASTYGAIVSPAFVAAVAREAERDLRGQVVPGSLGEMLHRLVAFRLQELTQGRTPPDPVQIASVDE